VTGAPDHDGASLAQAWSDAAEGWIRWARTPDHDDFYDLYNLPRFLELVPAPTGLTLDVGCGEGRVARVLRARGHRVIGAEQAPVLAAAAHTFDPPTTLARANGVALPFRSGVADLVVCFMVLQDVDELDRVCAELARVLRPGGAVCAGIVHPMVTAGFFDPDEPVLYVGRYSEVMRYDFAVERDGIGFTFHGVHRPLARYSEAFERAGLVIEAVREPIVTDEHVAVNPSVARHQLVPNFLHLRLRKAPA
jgi:SAM-dependent methyltransferase